MPIDIIGLINTIAVSSDAAYKIICAAIDSRDAKKINEALHSIKNELSNQATNNATLVRLAHTLLAENMDIKEKLREANEKIAERECYSLQITTPGVFVYLYEPKPSKTHKNKKKQTKKHYVCQPCLDNETAPRKVILDATPDGLGLTCYVCKKFIKTNTDSRIPGSKVERIQTHYSKSSKLV